jgi:hypothetical protein
MATKKSASTEEVEPNVHAEAWAERQRDGRYDDPTVATPGVLEDIEGEGGPVALVDPENDPVGDPALDPELDNRDQVQPMLDTLRKDAEAQAEAAAEAPASTETKVPAKSSTAKES